MTSSVATVPRLPRLCTFARRWRRFPRRAMNDFYGSCRKLDYATTHIFRLVPVNPGPDIATSAAALTGMPVTKARKLLGR